MPELVSLHSMGLLLLSQGHLVPASSYALAPRTASFAASQPSFSPVCFPDQHCQAD